MSAKGGLLFLSVIMLLSACATVPSGPSVAVMPGPGKPFEVFQADDASCRQWAQAQIGGTSPGETANQNLATGAVVGTLAGAGLGAALGSISGNAGAGAAIGGAAGLLTGASIGGNQGAYAGYSLQRRYDIAYQQCMYAKGNVIPGARQHYYPSSPAPSAYQHAPPPPGYQEWSPSAPPTYQQPPQAPPPPGP